MKLIILEAGLSKAYKDAGHNAYFGNGFKAGVAFSEENNPVNAELLENLIRILDRIKECDYQDSFPSAFTRAEKALNKALNK